MVLASAPLAGYATASTSRSFMRGMKSGLPFFSCGRGGARVRVGGSCGGALGRGVLASPRRAAASGGWVRARGGGGGADHADEVDDDADGEQQDHGEDAEGDDQAHVQRTVR